MNTDLTQAARAAIREYALSWNGLIDILRPRDPTSEPSPMTLEEAIRRSERFQAAGQALASVPELDRPSELKEFLAAEANSPWSKEFGVPDGTPEQLSRWRECRANVVALGLSLE